MMSAAVPSDEHADDDQHEVDEQEEDIGFCVAWTRLVATCGGIASHDM